MRSHSFPRWLSSVYVWAFVRDTRMSPEEVLYIDHSGGINIFPVGRLSLRIEIVSTCRMSSRLAFALNIIAPDQPSAD